MMKIGIVTVFKTNNCGSYLQAWALQKKLAEMGGDVCFVNYEKAFDTFQQTFLNVLKCCLKLNIKRAGSIIQRNLDFKRMQKHFRVIPQGDDSLDLCFFGSDTIWNFEDKFFSENAAFFTGKGLNIPRYSYAASVGSTSSELFLNNKIACEEISHFCGIAVRDEHSENIVSQIVPQGSIVRTVDPTMLYNKDEYVKNFGKANKLKKPYIMVYHYGKIAPELLDKLKSFAKKNRLNIVNLGLYEKIFDKNLSFSPENFVTAFNGASYVFTNTFHGCVFSILFNKKFATDGFKKEKIRKLLEQFSLFDRVVESGEGLERAYTTNVDYDSVNKKILEEREKSLNYLRNALGRREGA